MRARIATAKAPDGVLDAKIGAGRLQDIELFAQAGALLGGALARDIPAGLAAARTAGLIDASAQTDLTTAYERLWALQSATRLLSSRPLDPDVLRAATRVFLIRAVDLPAQNDAGDLFEAQLDQIYTRTDTIISTALDAHKSGED
jgi:glutamate-ammonia-ligase adenylyltransferase